MANLRGDNQEIINNNVSLKFLEKFKAYFKNHKLAPNFNYLNTQQDWADLFEIPRSTIGYHLTGKRTIFSAETYN